MVNTWHIQPMQEKVGYTEHVRKLLFLNAEHRMGVGFFVFGGFNLWAQLFQPPVPQAKSAMTSPIFG